MRKDSLRQLDMKGRLGATDIRRRAPFQAGSSPVVIIQADDAGALLRFHGHLQADVAAAISFCRWRPGTGRRPAI